MAVELDGALGHLLHDQHGSELLGDGAKTKLNVRRVGNVPLAIGQAVTLFENDLVVVRDQDRARK